MRKVKVNIPVIDMQDVEHWEHTCPTCGAVTERNSIDRGLTSVFHGECGHAWKCDPFAKGGKEAIEP